MNDDTNSLHPWIEPELEARLTALVLGEASDFERDELERLLAERTELALYRKRLEAMHRMLREVAKGENAEEQGEWKLGTERREALLTQLSGKSSSGERVVVISGSRRRVPWGMVFRVSACVMVAALALGLMYLVAKPEHLGVEDEVGKLYTNSHAGGLAWDVPKAGGDSDMSMGKYSPAQKEWQHYYATVEEKSTVDRDGEQLALGYRAVRPPVPTSATPAPPAEPMMVDNNGQIGALNGTVALATGGDLIVSNVPNSPKVSVDSSGRNGRGGVGGGFEDFDDRKEAPAKQNEPTNGRFGTTTASPAPAKVGDREMALGLEGANTFTGGVTVSGGALVVSNPEPSRGSEVETRGTIGGFGNTTADKSESLGTGGVPTPTTSTLALVDADGDGSDRVSRSKEMSEFVESEVVQVQEGENQRGLRRENLAAAAPGAVTSPLPMPESAATPLSKTDSLFALDFVEKKMKDEEKTLAEVDRPVVVGAKGESQVFGTISGAAAVAENQPVARKEVSEQAFDKALTDPVAAPAPAPAEVPLAAAKPMSAAPAKAAGQITDGGLGTTRPNGSVDASDDLVISSGTVVTKMGAGTLSINGGVASDAPMPELQAGQKAYTGDTEVTAGRTFAAGGMVAVDGKPQTEEFRFINPNENAPLLPQKGHGQVVPITVTGAGAKAASESELAKRKQDVSSDGEAKGVEVSAGETLAMGSGGAVMIGGDFRGRNAVEFDGLATLGDGRMQIQSSGSIETLSRSAGDDQEHRFTRHFFGGADTLRGFDYRDVGQRSEVDKSVQDILALTPQVGQGQQRNGSTLNANTGGGGVMRSGGEFSVTGSGTLSALDVSEDEFLRQKAAGAAGFGFESPAYTNKPDEGNANSLAKTLGGASAAGPAADLFTTVYRVPPTFLAATTAGATVGDPFADPVSAGGDYAPAGRVTAKEILESAGISFPEGAAAIYNPETSQLIVRNTKDQSELVEAYIEGIAVSEPTPEPKATPAALDETSTDAEPFSTFSLHVSDVSFQLAKASLASGQWPEADKIRIEEFVNAFDYGDPMPGMGERVACRIDQAAHPFLQQRNLVRIALRTAEAGRSSGTPLRLTLLLDSSGSMERPDRRETVRRAFATLAGLLGENDRVTLVSFARQPRLVADAVPGNEATKLAETVAALPSEGGTNLEAALQLAFEKAREHQEPNAQNRIVLLTDGAANLGDAKAESLGQRVEMMREAGIAFDAAGFGAEGLNDEILEALTRKGDGRYYLLDRPEDAEDAFAKQIAGALRPAAKNVKVQVEFNPDRVKSYKLLGFEKHRLATEDFRNDAVDAAELAAAEAGVAVYQVEPIPGGEGDLGSVSVRFRDLDSGEMVERRWGLAHLPAAPAAEQAGDAILFATIASQFAAKLAGGPVGDVVDLGELARLAAELPESERVKELRTMIEQARGLEGNR